MLKFSPMFPIADATSGTVGACTCKGMLVYQYECNGDNPFRDVNNRQVIYNATSSYSIDTCNPQSCTNVHGSMHSSTRKMVMCSIPWTSLCSAHRGYRARSTFLEMEATHYGTTALTEAMLDDTSNAYFDCLV